MFRPGSRYEKVKAFEKDAEQGEVFRGVRPRDIGPATGVVEHTWRPGDRLDLLARHYYNEPRLWWRILDANPDLLFGGELSGPGVEGRVVLIPRPTE